MLARARCKLYVCFFFLVMLITNDFDCHRRPALIGIYFSGSLPLYIVLSLLFVSLFDFANKFSIFSVLQSVVSISQSINTHLYGAICVAMCQVFSFPIYDAKIERSVTDEEQNPHNLRAIQCCSRPSYRLLQLLQY